MSKKFSRNLGNTGANMAVALALAAGALVTPGQAEANIPDSGGSEPTSSIQEQFRKVIPEFQDRIFFGAPQEMEHFYKPYSTNQLDRIVKSFLLSLADTYDRNAAIPIIPLVAPDLCAGPSNQVLFEIKTRPELRHTAAFFRDVVEMMPAPGIQPDLSRAFAVSVLFSLGPYMPRNVLNSDQTVAPNPLATHRGGVLLRLVDKDYFSNLHATRKYVGSIDGKDPAMPEAAILKAPDYGVEGSGVMKTMARILDLGDLLSTHVTEKREFPILMLMADTPEGNQGWVSNPKNRAKATPFSCMPRLKPQ